MTGPHKKPWHMVSDRQAAAVEPPERPSVLVVMDSGVWVGKAICPSSGAVPQLSCAQDGRDALAVPGEPPVAPCRWRRLVLCSACPGALCLYALLSASERKVLR